jgi:hypothetical protein
MNKLLKSMVLSLVMIFMAGTVWAVNIDDHVKIAPNGKGDVLIYPFYAAIDGGWETKLTVVNTDTTLSTVAKVVVRSPIYSEELLDFFIYLSPTDMWTGTLKFDATLGAIMESDDDSIVTRLAANGTPVWGNEEIARRALITPSGVGDFNEMGYVYVVNIATWYEGMPAVDKEDIYDEYQIITAIDPNYLPQNILAGWQDFQVADFVFTSSLNAVTLRDYQNREVATVATETKLGTNALNNLMEIEAALSKNDIALPYINTADDLSVHMMTFPTKYSQIDANGLIDGVDSPFTGFDSELDWCVRYKLNLYDTEEDTLTPTDPIWSPAPPSEYNDLCFELNWLVSSDSPFEEGWIRYNFNYTTTDENYNEVEMSYTGAPVIPVGLNLGMNGMSLKYGAWTDGEVSSSSWYGGDVIDFYQYADFADVP